MQTYRYQNGDRPLPGYTIQAAAGRGGFGEVYYALSDSGREVALKAIQGHASIELRGIAQCMNLKSPHLVTIFDVRRNEAGEPFVIMEYIAGVSLRQMLDGQPDGLGPAKAAFFLREIARGLSYLHSCGIIHRDLKPANIFFENGTVKIGDYGLSKAISTDHHASQTITVGTVHYMAPEIGSGRYDRSIDIYALGVLLYEMLTGSVPYRGSSPSEVLMKHLTRQPDLEQVDEPFRSVIAKALVKDPSQRYATVDEMVADLFDAELVRTGVASLGPQDLSVAAGQVAAGLRGAEARGVAVAEPGSGQQEGMDRGGAGAGAGVARGADGGGWGEAEEVVTHRGPGLLGMLRQAAADRASGGRGAGGRPGAEQVHQQARDDGAESGGRGDPLTFRQRLTLTVITLGIVAVATGLFAGGGPEGIRSEMAMLFSLTFALGATLGLRAAQTRLLPALAHESDLIQRLATAGTAVAAGALVSSYILATSPETRQALTMTAVAIGVTLVLLDWRQPIDRDGRLSLSQAVGPAFIAWVLAHIVSGVPLLALGTTVGVSFAIQTLSPWRPRGRGKQATSAGGAQRAGDGEASARWKAWGEGEGGEPGWKMPPPLPPSTASRATGPFEWAEGVSPYSRLAALLLAAVPFAVGLNGLHRFYVGKVGTGIVWLLTFGLLGIGQLIDFILIAAGAFRDASRRPITRWALDPAPGQPVERSGRVQRGADVAAREPVVRTAGHATPSIGAVVASLLGWLAIAAAIGLSLAVGLGMPHALGLGELFGSEHVRVSINLANTVVVCLLVIGAVLMLLGRRWADGGHRLRAVIGIGTLAWLLMLTQQMLLRSLDPTPVGPQGLLENVRAALGQLQPEQLLFALTIFFTSIIVIAWPGQPKPAAMRPSAGAES